MKQTSVLYKHGELIREVAKRMSYGLERHKVKDSARGLSNLTCLLSGLAVFTFKHPSLLQFDHAARENQGFLENLKRLFPINDDIPCDTYMRERLDEIHPDVLRPSFQKLFQLLQRSKALVPFQFLGKYALVSLDATGMFSSNKVHCENCCEKHHRSGEVTYYHQLLSAALVHPDQKVVFPFAPEPIMQKDGNQKNDCERNAAKRWLEDFRREHPHLETVIVADGLFSNGPFIEMLREKKLSYILVCKETDHRYLADWIDNLEKTLSHKTKKDDVTQEYEYYEDVPLNDTRYETRVNVVKFKETKKGKTTSWMWVTNLTLKKHQLEEFVKGGRARWKIENETFNTLKNQGYEFEHNFGHGKKNLHTIFAMLMMLAFFIDQCLQKVNKTFQRALEKACSKKNLWGTMLFMVRTLSDIPSFDALYAAIADPPRISLPSLAVA